MKTSEPQYKVTSNSHSSAPFFNRIDAGDFFGDATSATAPFFGPSTIQPKLTVGRPDDKYEEEADNMADHVVQKLAHPAVTTPIQRVCEDCEQEELLQEKEELTASSSGGALQNSTIENALNASKGNGGRMESGVASDMGNAFGTDFSSVKIHTGTRAIQMNQYLRARAFTHGSDIYFNQGEYRPGSQDGKRLLAHELTHVIQQSNTSNRIQRFIEPASDNLAILRSAEVSIENLILVFTSNSALIYVTQHYSFSRDWIDTNIEQIRDELIRRLDIKAQQNRADHLSWFLRTLETNSVEDSNEERLSETRALIIHRLDNSWFTTGQRGELISRIVSRLDACARAYNFAALSIKLDLYRAAQERSALIQTFISVALPLVAHGLTNWVVRSYQTLPFTGNQFFNIEVFREVERNTPRVQQMTSTLINSLGQYAKSRISSVDHTAITDADSLIGVLFNQFNNGIIAIQDRVREQDYTDFELMGIYSNYNAISLNGVDYYRGELELLLREFEVINASPTWVGYNEIVFLNFNGERRLAVIWRPQNYFVNFVSDQMRPFALERNPHPRVIDAENVDRIPSEH